MGHPRSRSPENSPLSTLHRHEKVNLATLVIIINKRYYYNEQYY